MRARQVHSFTRRGDPYRKLGVGSHRPFEEGDRLLLTTDIYTFWEPGRKLESSFLGWKTTKDVESEGLELNKHLHHSKRQLFFSEKKGKTLVYREGKFFIQSKKEYKDFFAEAFVDFVKQTPWAFERLN